MNEVTPIRVSVTGAAGQIGYSLLFRIASGSMFGPNQPVALNLLEIEPAMKALEGVVMELQDCAFPLLTDVAPTCDLDEGFGDAGLCIFTFSIVGILILSFSSVTMSLSPGGIGILSQPIAPFVQAELGFVEHELGLSLHGCESFRFEAFVWRTVEITTLVAIPAISISTAGYVGK